MEVDVFRVELPSGTQLCGGKYVIERLIGEGGFGLTYQAVQLGLNRKVCIKEYFLSGKCVRSTRMLTVQCVGLTPELFEKYRIAFESEARKLAELSHPNIVEVIDVFSENGTSYMVMPYIEGQTLAGKIKDHGRICYDEAVNYIAQIAGAVGYIHERNILHRDIKPDNIMITPDDRAILIDFGSAREFANDQTQYQTVMVTHGYAPIEQYSTNSRKGYYTDIYALGGTLYYILTGKTPVSSEVRQLESMPTPREICPDIPVQADRTIMKAMQMNPAYRHRCIKEFMDDLLNIKPSRPIKIAGNSRRNWLIGLSAGIGFILIIVLLFSLFPKKHEIKTYDFISFGDNLYPVIKLVNSLDGFSGPVYIGQYEVSQDFWYAVMGERHSSYDSDLFENVEGMQIAEEDRGRFPVINTTFEEVEEFCRVLNEKNSQKTGKLFAVPSIGVWRFAAMGGKKGDTTVKYSTYTGEVGGVWYRKDTPCPVNYVSCVNRLGLFHMCGNVSEWCLYKQPANSSEIKMLRPVLCGGNFANVADDVTTRSIEQVDGRDIRYPEAGFRLICY